MDRHDLQAREMPIAEGAVEPPGLGSTHNGAASVSTDVPLTGELEEEEEEMPLLKSERLHDALLGQLYEFLMPRWWAKLLMFGSGVAVLAAALMHYDLVEMGYQVSLR